jgi:hypothetical protein
MLSSFLLILTVKKAVFISKLPHQTARQPVTKKSDYKMEVINTGEERPVHLQKGGNPGLTLQRLLQNQQCSICYYYRVRPFLFLAGFC